MEQQVACDSVAELANNQIIHSFEDLPWSLDFSQKKYLKSFKQGRGMGWFVFYMSLRRLCDQWIEAGGGKQGNQSGGYRNSPERGMSHLD